MNRKGNYRSDKLRVRVVDWDDSFIYACTDEETYTRGTLMIVYQKDEGFPVSLLWKDCRLNLIDFTVGGDGALTPQLIIIEPDYMLDVTSLAECVRDYGHHPLNYFKTKFETVRNNRHFMLGNAANLFLDECINERPDAPVSFRDCIRKFFKAYPFELSTCEGIDAGFFADAEMQFNNIRRVVEEVFPVEGIDRNCATLEPSFICEHLGIRGRLDLLQLKKGGNVVIELKSGKAPYPESNHSLLGVSHRVQAFLYQIVIQKTLGIDFSDLRTFILYSRYSAKGAGLRISRPYMGAIREALNIRNSIVAMERAIAGDGDNAESEKCIAGINPDMLITEASVNPNFLNNYIIPRIMEFRKPFIEASPLELSYFHSFHSFVTREHFYSKTGGVEGDFHRSFSSLWLSPFSEKQNEGEILFDLSVAEDRTAAEIPVIRLKIPPTVRNEAGALHNFRNGDVALLYERNSDSDTVVNRQVFRGTVESLTVDEISVRLRLRQRKAAAFAPDSRYAIEHDYMEASQSIVYKSLYMFLQGNRDRRDLLLGQRNPRRSAQRRLNGGTYVNGEINSIVLKAKQADDYFILVGPPGTGKTSCALKSMVEEFYSDEGVNILLLSYTNHAVDEICEALESIEAKPPYIRIGLELSCSERYRDRLLDRMMKPFERREQVQELIGSCRIFVATTASFAGKMEIFDLKRFHVAIIDEASQILEPQIVGILSAKDREGNNGIGRFVLIGDYKQLPAVVMQSVEESHVSQPELRKVGLTNMRNSLFERLYRTNEAAGNDYAIGLLNRQGRMHPEISLFPNLAFYSNRLLPVPLKHQEEELEFVNYDSKNAVEKLVATQRLLFVASGRGDSRSIKSNINEARVVARLAAALYGLYGKNAIEFDCDRSIGVIAPYRSQIAMIRNEISRLDIPALNDITVDTVERYQGSQRDAIIYSFSVNERHQLDFMSSITMEDDFVVDRRLNVAITRAGKQMFAVGNPSILSGSPIYSRFIEFLGSRSGIIPEEIFF